MSKDINLKPFERFFNKSQLECHMFKALSEFAQVLYSSNNFSKIVRFFKRLKMYL